MSTPMEWASMKWKEQAKYLDVCLETDKIVRFGLTRVLPVRRHNHEAKPYIGGEEMVSGIPKNKESQWVHPEVTQQR